MTISSSLYVAVVQLTRFDADRKPILPGGQRAGSVSRERTGRVDSFVEVQFHLAVLRQVRVEKSSRGIGFLPGCPIAKDEEEKIAFSHRIKPQLLPVQ